MNYIEKYYSGIKSGKIVVSDKVRRVFKHLTEKINDKNAQYIYDDSKAQYAIDFIQTFCKHSKGKWGGKPVILELWQKAITAALFGFVKMVSLHLLLVLVFISWWQTGKLDQRSIPLPQKRTRQKSFGEKPVP